MGESIELTETGKLILYLAAFNGGQVREENDCLYFDQLADLQGEKPLAIKTEKDLRFWAAYYRGDKGEILGALLEEES